MTLASIRQLVANDAHACTFQSFGQYRTALLKAIDAALPTPGATTKQIPAGHAETVHEAELVEAHTSAVSYTLPQTDMSAAETARAGGYRIFKDGDQWCAVDHAFIDLQQSPAGFANTPGLALEQLMKEFGKEWAKKNGEWVKRAHAAAREDAPPVALSAPPAPGAAIDAGGQEAKVVPRGVYGPDDGRPGEPYGNADWIAQNHEAVIQFLERALAAPGADAPQVCASTCTRAKIDRLPCKCYPCITSSREALPASTPPIAAVAQPDHEGWRYEVWTQGQSDPQPNWEDEFSRNPPHSSGEHKGSGPPKTIGAWRNLRPMYEGAAAAQPVAMTRAEVDRIVYACRQSGDDSTYAIVNAALAASPIAPQAGQAGEEKGRG